MWKNGFNVVRNLIEWRSWFGNDSQALLADQSAHGGLHRHQPKTFAHGLVLADCKAATASLPIRQFPFAPVMSIPLRQHIGKAALPVVQPGQEVNRGQLLAKPDGFLSVAMHAPVSGIVKKIDWMPTIQGNMEQGIYLQTYPAATQEVIEGVPCLPTAPVKQMLEAMQNAGIVGLGGAAFPSHVKLTIPEGKFVDTLLINGVECEPYLTTDHRVMLEQSADIILGIRYLLRITGAQQAIIAIEANKLDAVETLQNALPDDMSIRVQVVAVKYPQGAEKILIKTLFKREIPAGKHAIDVHVLGVNVATTAEIGRLLPHGRGIQERVITISGPAVKRPGNYRIAIGTPVRFALEQVGVADDLAEVFLGGPMMGQAVSHLDIPITKGVSGIIALTTADAHPDQKIYPCIHCGGCVSVCPMFLNPSQLGLLAKQQNYARMVTEFNLLECFECGACDYVCPSHIPLLQYIRVAKQSVKKQRRNASSREATE